MSNDNTIDCSNIGKFKDELTAILCEGARRLLQVAVEAELGEFLKQHEDRRTGQNLRLVVRSGHHPERLIQTGIGPVPVRIPKVRSNDGKPVTFRSSVVPPHVRKSRTLEAWVPWLYRKGVSTGEMAGVLSGLPGAQDRQCAGRHAEGHPSRGEVGTAADPDGGDPGPGRPGLRPFPGPLPGEVSQGRGEADPGSQGADELLRLPGRALAEHSHHQPDRVDLCHDPPPDPDDPGLPEPRHHARHDVQARPVRGIPLAKAARVPQAGTGHRGSAVPGRNRGTIRPENGGRWMNPLYPHALLSAITRNCKMKQLKRNPNP